MPSIELQNITKNYGGGTPNAVEDLNLTIEDGDFMCLLGPSGCGKTTTLRMICGLENPTRGTIRIGDRVVDSVEDGIFVPPEHRRLGLVFQSYALWPHLSVYDNVDFGLKLKKIPQQERSQRVGETMEKLGISAYAKRYPSELSGGQQQRVALARMLAINPEILLLDEPLSNLDARLRLEARTFLKRLQRDLGVTTVFVTHDQAEALALADRMAIMRDGRIQQVGSPREVFARPANTFVAGFVGSTPMNLHPAVVEGGRVSLAGTSLSLPPDTAGAVTDGQKVIWGARPEYLSWSPSTPAPDDDAVEGEVTVAENLGASVLVTVNAQDTLIQVVVDEENEPDIGARGWVRARPGRTLLFDAESEELLGASPGVPTVSAGTAGESA